MEIKQTEIPDVLIKRLIFMRQNMNVVFNGMMLSWQYTGAPVISEKDALGTQFKEADSFE